MKFTVTLPALPGLHDKAGVVAAWRKEIGEAVLIGETLAVVGEAAAIAPVAGILTKKYALVGEAIAVGEPLALLSGVLESPILEGAKYVVPPAATFPVSVGSEEVRRLTEQEREIARHHARSAQIAPHVFTIARADLTEATRLAARVGVPLLPFVIHCVAASLMRYPLLHSRLVGDDEIHLTRLVHIAVTRSVGGRLYAPVLQDADKRSLLMLARELASLFADAEAGILPPEAQRGATFTVVESPAGILYQSAILHQPQVGLLSIGPTENTPAPASHGDDIITLMPSAYLCLTHDARVVDNETAAAFLMDVKRGVEEAGFLFA